MSEPASMTLDEALTEVEARFIVTLPKQEIKQTERLFFHIEQAYWFYEVIIPIIPASFRTRSHNALIFLTSYRISLLICTATCHITKT